MGPESLLSFWHEESAFKTWDFGKEEGGNCNLKKKKKSVIVQKVDTPGNYTPWCLFPSSSWPISLSLLFCSGFSWKRWERKLNLELEEERQAPPVSLVTGLWGPREQERAGCRQPFLSSASSVHSCKGETQSKLHWEVKKPVFIEHVLWPGTGHSFAPLISPNKGKVSIIIPVVQVRKQVQRDETVYPESLSRWHS